MVVDSSALMAIALQETTEGPCRDAFATTPQICMSATTLMELLVVARSRGVTHDVEELLAARALEIVPVTEARARAAADAYTRWGKGMNPAKLNLADCFAYALAQERRVPLLYVGDDFAQTDVASAIPRDDV